MTERDVILVIIGGLLLLGVIGLIVFMRLARESRRRAPPIRQTAGPPRWSSLALQERARLRSKPRALGRRHATIHPGETFRDDEHDTQ